MAAADNVYLLFAAGALAAAFLGLFLALLLPLALLVDWHWGLHWVALAQAHGHVQVIGWAGLFSFGMGYRLIPRFSGTPLRGRTLVVPSFVLLTLAIALRLALQPLSDHEGARQLLPLAGLLELAAATIFAGLTLPLLRRPLRKGAGFAPYFVALALWLMVQAALTTVWLWDIARAGTLVLPGTRNEVLLTIQFFGVLLTAIIGVSFRTLPIFFQQPLPDLRSVWPCFTLLQGGLALYVIVAMGYAYSPREALRILALAALLVVAAGVVAPIPLTGVWRTPSRLRPAARPAAIFIQAAYGWTAVGGALLAYSAISALIHGGLPAHYHVDAVRHVLAIGTVTMMIIGMTYLLTPAFALPRQKRPQSVREIRLIWAALMLATVLRFLSAWIQDPQCTGLRFWLMGIAAALFWLAIAIFARALYREARPQPLPPLIVAHRYPQV